MNTKVAEVLDYIIDSMTPSKVLEIPLPSDDEGASQFVSALKQRAYERVDEPMMPVEDPTDEQIAASIVRGLEQARLGQGRPLEELWAELDDIINEPE
jgi:hypothetical protein